MTTIHDPHTAHPLATVATLPASLILAGRILAGWRTNKAAVVIAWVFPIFVTLLFIGLLGGAMELPAGESYVDFVMPGMLAVTMLFGLETTTLATAADAAKGLNDRFRSMPISAAAVPLARCLADMLGSAVGLGVMVLFGLAIGWRPGFGLGGALAAVALLTLLRFSLLWIGLTIGQRSTSVESVAFVQILVWPIAMLSSVFVDPATMPRVLRWVAELNPISATATTLRDLAGTATWSGQALSADVSALLAVAWPGVLMLLFVPAAARAFRYR
ncbi:ABC transporter permease [Nocardioides okcheonensis]|uniref:ABC transporter permease n=1 Tax=Nocardioides okcheonensis TaxID=2894081 RepID=UPI001E4F19FE|nr:ABC transporter permease [Nocardioides okcheonensis]UFN45160.1 ABC transporter permease [Nocardioides okcheonensis]